MIGGNKRTTMGELRIAMKLLHECSAHVWRQQFAGKHVQDKKDAVALCPKLEAFFERHGEGV